jgi:hypothetical protein
MDDPAKSREGGWGDVKYKPGCGDKWRETEKKYEVQDPTYFGRSRCRCVYLFSLKNRLLQPVFSLLFIFLLQVRVKYMTPVPAIVFCPV